MAKQQRLSVEQYVLITDWLKMNRDRIEGNSHTQLEVSGIAEKELGFFVPLTTVQRCAKIAKVKWANSPPPPPPLPIDREAIIILISALEGLYIETRGSAPQNLVELKSAYVQNSAKKKSIASQVQNKDIQYEGCSDVFLPDDNCVAFDSCNKGDDLHKVGRGK